MSLTGPAVAFVATLLIAAAPAVAGVGHSAKVRHSDLNLASADGQRAFERRVTATARQVCGIDPRERQLAIRLRNQQCLRDAVASAQPAVDVAISRARTGQAAAADVAQQ